VIERYSFVTVTTEDLERARDFWVNALGFPVTEEQVGRFFIVNAGGLRLCVDLADETHQAGSSDPIIGFEVTSLQPTLDALAKQGIKRECEPVATTKGAWTEIRDPDGRIVILTEGD
jgi:catechol 2,3-dioxygenase-like lactoylglutathione lyase family enzyme